MLTLPIKSSPFRGLGGIMFTGIIETLGKVTNLQHELGNLHITVESAIADDLKIDQSVAHNGVCLTVVALTDGKHTVTAIEETLNKTNLGDLKTGVGSPGTELEFAL